MDSHHEVEEALLRVLLHLYALKTLNLVMDVYANYIHAFRAYDKQVFHSYLPLAQTFRTTVDKQQPWQVTSMPPIVSNPRNEIHFHLFHFVELLHSCYTCIIFISFGLC